MHWFHLPAEADRWAIQSDTFIYTAFIDYRSYVSTSPEMSAGLVRPPELCLIFFQKSMQC